MLQNSNPATIQPKVVVIRRRPNQGFGFTLRHFIAYPPEDDPSWPKEATESPYQQHNQQQQQHHQQPQQQVKAMETIFIKEVQPNGPAFYANLQTGDRVLMVNNTPIAGIAYSTIVSMIKQTPAVLTLHVVPKECDVLQMHYTSIAHTPESNRLNATVPLTKSINSIASAAAATTAPTVGNGNVAGALIPLISYPSGSRSSSITSTTSNNQQRPSLVGSSDYSEMATQGLHATTATLLLRNDAGLARSQPSNLQTVLPTTRQQQQQQQQQQQLHHTNASYYAANISGLPSTNAVVVDNSDLMVRLRESIKQKEEFLKSPLPHAPQIATSLSSYSNQQQHFFPHTPPSGSPQLSAISTSTTSVGSSLAAGVGGHNSGSARGQVRTIVKQPLSATSSSSSSTRELLPTGYDMQNSYTKNFVSNYTLEGRDNVVGLPAEIVGTRTAFSTLAANSQQRATQFGNNGNQSSYSGLVSSLRDKYSKDLDYLETLQETGVTNKVFERKLVSHMSKGFDPFKPLSINTNALVEAGNVATASSNTVAMMRKPGVLYESLQNHPLHQLQQLQQPPLGNTSNQLTGRVYVSNNAIGGHNVIDGQSSSRMEIHKASLATTIENTQSKYTNNKSEDKVTIQQQQSQHQLGNIAESAYNNDLISSKAKTSDGIVRRLKPAASLDDGKPMRRISYLRATNNENEYQTPAEIASTTTTTASVTATMAASSSPAAAAAAVKSASAILEASKERSLEEDSDPTYDVVAGDCEPKTDLKNSSVVVSGGNGAIDIAAKAAAATATACTLSSSNNGRRTSINCEIRNSTLVDSLDAAAATAAQVNGKLDTKNGSSEMETFETEMEIKSTCINGKRMSEYRSWKPVKIEIKGDMLKIFSSRTSKPDSNVIEIDIRNFKIFDESVEKKKFIFRMQSKPTAHIATLGNEMNLDDVHTEKLSTSATAAGGNGSTALMLGDHPQQLQQQPHTEILFKAKSINEMRRIFGLLQWKNSLIYDDSDLQGKQLAEPQKTAAITSMPTATYCDDIVQPPPQQQQLQPPSDYSPLSSTSRGEIEVSDSISPVMKTRKSTSHKNIPDKDLGSPKAKNWKDLIFRRGGSSHSSADVSPSNLSSAAKTTGSIGVPLKSCPMSKCNEYVPNIVEVCTNIVETKGLSVVGIYRIPGNKAAISELSDQVNKSDFSWERVASDVRWEDVNVVSSLLKLFIRSLPDALLPSSFYINFIEADKKTGLVRLKELKHLLASLPRYSYETMKHLIRHLSRVSKNCEVNLMEPKNLAIIFGPSIIRTPNDTLEIAVKDMKHQCRIVELLVSQYDYFFESGNTPDISDVSGNVSATQSSDTSAATVAQAQENQTNMLLHNVSKIERLTERETSSRTSRFIPQLRRRTHSKRSAVSSDTYSGESVLSLDYTSKSSSQAGGCGGGGGSSSGSSSTNATINSTSGSCGSSKKERFLSSAIRAHHRKASLDEKDSGSASGSGGSLKKEQQRSSVDISILLTDDESSNSRNSDTGSMSLNAVTDTLDSKLKNLRSGSESNDEENTAPEFPKNRRHTLGQPLHLHSENIPYADESPERHFHNAHPLDLVVPLNPLTLSRSCTNTNTIGAGGGGGGGGGVGGGGVARMAQEFTEREKDQRKLLSSHSHSPYKSHKLQHSATVPINSSNSANISSGSILSPPSMASTPTAVVTVKTTTMPSNAISNIGGSSGGGAPSRNSYTCKNLRFSSSVYEQCCSEDDSEGSTTSDPKESLVITSPSFFLDRYNKKRRDHRLFRSASFNCRNYTTRHGGNVTAGGGIAAAGGGAAPVSAGLTKDEKTDMNLTKKRQIQNKQNRSIKRRHTVGGPHDYSSTNAVAAAAGGSNCQNHNCKGKAPTGSTTTSSTTVIRRIPLSSANVNIANNNNNNNNNNSSSSPQQSDGSSSNGNSSSGGASTTVAVTGDHVLEVGIRIKNINRSRY